MANIRQTQEAVEVLGDFSKARLTQQAMEVIIDASKPRLTQQALEVVYSTTIIASGRRRLKVCFY